MVDGQQCDVQRWVHEHDLRRIGVAVVVVDGHGVESLDHMVVRDEEIVVFQVEAAARAAGMRNLEL